MPTGNACQLIGLVFIPYNNGKLIALLFDFPGNFFSQITGGTEEEYFCHEIEFKGLLLLKYRIFWYFSKQNHRLTLLRIILTATKTSEGIPIQAVSLFKTLNPRSLKNFAAPKGETCMGRQGKK